MHRIVTYIANNNIVLRTDIIINSANIFLNSIQWENGLEWNEDKSMIYLFQFIKRSINQPLTSLSQILFSTIYDYICSKLLG